MEKAQLHHALEKYRFQFSCLQLVQPSLIRYHFTQINPICHSQLCIASMQLPPDGPSPPVIAVAVVVVSDRRRRRRARSYDDYARMCQSPGWHRTVCVKCCPRAARPDRARCLLLRYVPMMQHACTHVPLLSESGSGPNRVRCYVIIVVTCHNRRRSSRPHSHRHFNQRSTCSAGRCFSGTELVACVEFEFN